MDDDTEPPMDGPGEESQHSSDAGEPRLLESSHRAVSDGLGGFVNPSDIRALRVVSKTVRDSRVLVAIKRAMTHRWTACAASKRARRRLEAVDAMGRFLGPDAEAFLTAIFRDDKLQTVRAAAATWLARVARRAGPVTKQRIFAAACERYDAETLKGCMNVRQAIERSFPDVYQSYEEVTRMHPNKALAGLVAATLALREDRLQRQQEALKAAAAGVMGGKIHLFREDADLRRVHFKLERGRDDALKLAFANPLERSVLLRKHESRGLRGDQKLEVVEIPPRSVRHFATIDFSTPSATFTSSWSDLPQGRWVLRMPIMERTPTEADPRNWIAAANGLLRLEARLRARDDARGAEHSGSEPPFELWTFELGAGVVTCRVDPVLRNSVVVAPAGEPDRTRYHPQPPPAPPSAQWRQSLREERERPRIPPPRPGSRYTLRPRYTHSEWLHRYPDPVQLLPAAGPINLDVEARPGHPREFLFSDEAEPHARMVYNQWPALRRKDPASGR